MTGKIKIKKIGLVCGIVLAVSCAGCVVAAESSDTEIYGANPQYDREIPHTDYIIADSDQRYLTKDDVRGFSLRAINYAKNEIFARRGRKFLSNELQTYFNGKDWYCGIFIRNRVLHQSGRVSAGGWYAGIGDRDR